jgi:hypothetical protein
MFTQASRYSFQNDEAKAKADAIYAKAQALWENAGCKSMQRFEIVEGENKGQHLVVIRYPTHRAWTDARNQITEKREELSNELGQAGIELEDMMLLDEV